MIALFLKFGKKLVSVGTAIVPALGEIVIKGTLVGSAFACVALAELALPDGDSDERYCEQDEAL